MTMQHQLGKRAYEIAWYVSVLKNGTLTKVLRTGVYNFNNLGDAERAARSANKLSQTKVYFVREHEAK